MTDGQILTGFDEIVDYLSADGGKVPCSRYGHDSESCAYVAGVLCLIMEDATGEQTTDESADYIMGLVVNDHDDVEIMIRDYASLVGFDADEVLD